MTYIQTFQESLRLVSREEGKIKSYKSSLDLRSWSHDVERRNRYLKEWIKSDMPICVIPVHILAKFLNTMTFRSRRKVAPKCHPDCKSKSVLESICNSCHAMQECLKKEASLHSYFQEEEFETCHWPCEKCLDVLKSIKMFWKIIVEKIFHISLTKTEGLDHSSSMRQQADTVQSVAKIWEKEIIEQALFVKQIVPLLTRKTKGKNTAENKKIAQKESQTCGDVIALHKSLPKSSLNCKRSGNTAKPNDKVVRRKVTKCTSVKVLMVDVETNTNIIENDEAKLYRHNVEYLQKKFNRQVNEMEHLKRENNSLKLELENFYESCSCKVPFIAPAILMKPHQIDPGSVLPKPFETDEVVNDSATKLIDSEMIITMKNCRNENFKHVSLLQVLHKTNEPMTILDSINKPCHSKENPIELLTKVQNTFGELVRREMDVVNKVNKVNITSKDSEITASFYRVNASKSEPSCTTLDICSKMNTSSSESHFVSL